MISRCVSQELSHPGICLEELRKTTKNVGVVDVSTENSGIRICLEELRKTMKKSGYSICQPICEELPSFFLGGGGLAWAGYAVWVEVSHTTGP